MDRYFDSDALALPSGYHWLPVAQPQAAGFARKFVVRETGSMPCTYRPNDYVFRADATRELVEDAAALEKLGLQFRVAAGVAGTADEVWQLVVWTKQPRRWTLALQQHEADVKPQWDQLRAGRELVLPDAGAADAAADAVMADAVEAPAEAPKAPAEAPKAPAEAPKAPAEALEAPAEALEAAAAAPEPEAAQPPEPAYEPEPVTQAALIAATRCMVKASFSEAAPPSEDTESALLAALRNDRRNARLGITECTFCGCSSKDHVLMPTKKPMKETVKDIYTCQACVQKAAELIAVISKNATKAIGFTFKCKYVLSEYDSVLASMSFVLSCHIEKAPDGHILLLESALSPQVRKLVAHALRMARGYIALLQCSMLCPKCGETNQLTEACMSQISTAYGDEVQRHNASKAMRALAEAGIHVPDNVRRLVDDALKPASPSSRNEKKLASDYEAFCKKLDYKFEYMFGPATKQSTANGAYLAERYYALRNRSMRTIRCNKCLVSICIAGEKPVVYADHHDEAHLKTCSDH